MPACRLPGSPLFHLIPGPVHIPVSTATPDTAPAFRLTCCIRVDDETGAVACLQDDDQPLYVDAHGVPETLLGTPVVSGAFLMNLAFGLIRAHLQERGWTVAGLDCRFVWLAPVGALLTVEGRIEGRRTRICVYCHEQRILDGTARLTSAPIPEAS